METHILSDWRQKREAHKVTLQGSRDLEAGSLYKIAAALLQRIYLNAFSRISTGHGNAVIEMRHYGEARWNSRECPILRRP